MSNHETTLVPLEAWCYASPEVRASGRSTDIGLLCEALIYYESTLVNVTNQGQLVELIGWLQRENRLADFIALVREGTITFYDYPFLTSPVQKDGVYQIFNLQDPVQKKPNSFKERFLVSDRIRRCFADTQKWKKFCSAVAQNVIEVRVQDFGPAIEHAREDLDTPERTALIVQSFLDELYSFKRLGKPPIVSAEVTREPDRGTRTLRWNVDFRAINRTAGPGLDFHDGVPLAAAAIGNRLLWSSSQSQCDLYLPPPMSNVVGDKLFEVCSRIKTRAVIEQLHQAVEFPDVRRLVNSRALAFAEVLKIRSKAGKFRQWLQTEAERDRNAIIAYHHEVSRESGLTRAGRKMLHVFGLFAGGAAGATVGSLVEGSLGGAIGGALGAAAGNSVGYIADLGARMRADWKPIVFGHWFDARIKALLNSRSGI